MTDLGERIRSARTSRGWTQLTLAKKLGVSKLTVLKYENGQAVPREANRARLFALLGISEPVGGDEAQPIQRRSQTTRGEVSIDSQSKESFVNNALDRMAVAAWWYEQLPVLLHRGITNSQSLDLIRNAVASAHLTARSADVDMFRLPDHALVELISPHLSAHLTGHMQLVAVAGADAEKAEVH
jgi:transcriptional regulator with XRE-family HTH domain